MWEGLPFYTFKFGILSRYLFIDGGFLSSLDVFLFYLAIIPMLLTEAKRNHIMVIAAGIGACRQSIHSEFPENFLDISDMNSMPRNICNIIKRKLVK